MGNFWWSWNYAFMSFETFVIRYSLYIQQFTYILWRLFVSSTFFESLPLISMKLVLFSCFPAVNVLIILTSPKFFLLSHQLLLEHFCYCSLFIYKQLIVNAGSLEANFTLVTIIVYNERGNYYKLIDMT